MAGGNSTISFSKITCNPHLVSSFRKSMVGKIWLVNALQLGTTTLFLAVISTVVSMGAGSNGYDTKRYDMDNGDSNQLIAKCEPMFPHSILVEVWASLIIMINTSAVVAVDDRDGGSMGPPFELLVKGVWTFYLGMSYIILFINRDGFYYPDDIIHIALEVVPFAVICIKMVFKYCAFEKARQSFALGRNPHLIFGHMKQQTSHHGELVVCEDAPPPLLVMGEEKRHVEKQPLGLDHMLPTSTLKPQKDLRFSFALFKLLRCRFARYKVTNNAGSKSMDALSFFWSLLLKDGEHDRVFLVISDELSFLHDYYYSSLPIYYSRYWLPILGIFISLLCIVCCVLLIPMLVWRVLLYFLHSKTTAQRHLASRRIWKLVSRSSASIFAFGVSHDG
ncbi:hypothetical protein PVAP13_2NG041258 [Panicum virgatum]|uniref:DUF4220 domain-containing protein n=1 Tax=Panicum virgatum TaxID=38727 RepID=A0A8T0VAP1_PANVG|nr:hypothetical protein PVAP13_2NG041258 [Panicum virgatum]